MGTFFRFFRLSFITSIIEERDIMPYTKRSWHRRSDSIVPIWLKIKNTWHVANKIKTPVPITAFHDSGAKSRRQHRLSTGTHLKADNNAQNCTPPPPPPQTYVRRNTEATNWLPHAANRNIVFEKRDIFQYARRPSDQGSCLPRPTGNAQYRSVPRRKVVVHDELRTGQQRTNKQKDGEDTGASHKAANHTPAGFSANEDQTYR